MNQEGFLESRELLAYLGALEGGAKFDLPLVVVSIVKLVQRLEYANKSQMHHSQPCPQCAGGVDSLSLSPLRASALGADAGGGSPGSSDGALRGQ